MKFNGKRIKEDNKYQKHESYKISKTRTINFKEVQQDGSIDRVDINILLKENQEAIFSEEYKPKAIDTCKKVDIMVFIYGITDDRDIDKGSEATLYLYDVKDTIGGKDVIFHLVEQWKEGIRSALDFTRYATETRYNIGVITRNYDTKRIDEEITKCEKELSGISSQKNMPALVLAKNYINKRIVVEKELEILKSFRNMIFFEGKEKYTYNYKLMDKNNYYLLKIES